MSRPGIAGSAGFERVNNPGNWDATAMQEYMSPYQQGVTDIAKREALRVYDGLRTRLQQDLGAVPSTETQELHKQLLR